MDLRVASANRQHGSPQFAAKTTAARHHPGYASVGRYCNKLYIMVDGAAPPVLAAASVAGLHHKPRAGARCRADGSGGIRGSTN